ncbi:TPA: hypothetical protein ACYRHK_004924, partial [Escherichia coli]
CTTNLKIEVSVQFLIPTGFVTQKITDLWIQFSSTAGPDGKQVISVREESLSGCYRRNSHGTPTKHGSKLPGGDGSPRFPEV